MNEEQFQRHVDFIVAQQAKFEVGIARLKEELAENGKQTKENTRNIAKLGELILSLAKHSQSQDEQIAALIEAGKETDRRFRETDERMRETDERMKKTDERMRETDERMKKTDERLRQTDERMRQTDERMRETDERIGILIKAVERFYNKNGND
jgi:methyl-accepting chemotaxis protein